MPAAVVDIPVVADIREAGIAKKRAAIVKDVSCELM
jgi:hypothetical protein